MTTPQDAPVVQSGLGTTIERPLNVSPDSAVSKLDDSGASEHQGKLPDDDIGDRVRRRIRERFWHLVDYLSIFLFIMIIYVGFLGTEKTIIWLVFRSLEEDIAKYPVVALWFERLKIGLALLISVGAFLHAVWAVYKQIRIDVEMTQEAKTK